MYIHIHTIQTMCTYIYIHTYISLRIYTLHNTYIHIYIYTYTPHININTDMCMGNRESAATHEVQRLQSQQR